MSLRPSAVTLREVAEQAGVHPGTASRALNPETRELVSPATAQRVLDAAKTLKYQPNPLARGLKTSRTMTVGIVVPDLSNPLFAPMVRAAEDTLAHDGYVGLITDTDNDPAVEEQRFSMLLGRHVDGFILASAHRNDPTLERAVALETPVVLLNRRDDASRLPAVVADDERGIRDAVTHLHDLGHRRIAHVAGPRNTSAGENRAVAFVHVMDQLGLALDPEMLVESSSFTYDGGRDAARQLLAHAEPTAVVSGNDQIAIGLMDVAAEAGLAVPGDLSVVGFNDIPLVDRMKPSLTTVCIPAARMGTAAARIVLQIMREGRAENTTLTFPVNLVVRGSTAPPGV